MQDPFYFWLDLKRLNICTTQFRTFVLYKLVKLTIQCIHLQYVIHAASVPRAIGRAAAGIDKMCERASAARRHLLNFCRHILKY
jgi:hypothetical protein